MNPFAAPAAPVTAPVTNPFASAPPPPAPPPPPPAFAPPPPDPAAAWGQPAAPAWAPPSNPQALPPVADIGAGPKIGTIAGIGLIVHGLALLASSTRIAGAIANGEYRDLSRMHGLGIMVASLVIVVGLYRVAKRSQGGEMIASGLALFGAMGLFFAGVIFGLAADSTDSFGLGTHITGTFVVGLTLLALLFSIKFRPDPLALAAAGAVAATLVGYSSASDATSSGMLVLTRGLLPGGASILTGVAVMLQLRQRGLTSIGVPVAQAFVAPVIPLALNGTVDLSRYRSPRPWAIAVACLMPLGAGLGLLGEGYGIAGSLLDGAVAAMFAYTACRNCHAFGAARMRFSPGACAGMLVLPLASVIAAPYALQEIWQRSYGATQTEPSRTIRTAYLMMRIGMVATIFIPAVFAGYVASQDPRSSHPEKLVAPLTALLMVIIMSGFVVRAVAFFQIAKRQEDSFRRLSVIHAPRP